MTAEERACAHGHTTRQIGCVSCVLVFDHTSKAEDRAGIVARLEALEQRLDDGDYGEDVEWRDHKLTARAAITEIRRLEQERDVHRACPCLHTTPCHPRCTCVVPISSSGCHRCCSYGSRSQQKAMAEHLASIEARADALQRDLEIVKLSVPLEEELSNQIDEMLKYLAMQDGFTLAGIARLLMTVQRRMAADWETIGRERRERNALQRDLDERDWDG